MDLQKGVPVFESQSQFRRAPGSQEGVLAGNVVAAVEAFAPGHGQLFRGASEAQGTQQLVDHADGQQTETTETRLT